MKKNFATDYQGVGEAPGRRRRDRNIREPRRHKLRSTGERECQRAGRRSRNGGAGFGPSSLCTFRVVYRDFQDISEFADEINKLASTRKVG